MIKNEFSVIIPVFNGEKYFAEAVKSVLGQTFRPKQILIVDDGSTDNTPQVAQSFGADVGYLQQANAGAAAARNLGIKNATGNIIVFLDADDIWEPTKLEQQAKVFDASPEVAIVFGHLTHFFSPELDEQQKANIFCPPDPVPGVVPTTVAIRTEAFNQVGLFETKWEIGEFVHWCGRARLLGLKEKTLPSVVAHRRLHGSNQGITKRQAMRDYLHIVKALKAEKQRLDEGS